MLLTFPAHVEPEEVVQKLNARNLKYLYKQMVQDTVNSLYPNQWCVVECVVLVRGGMFFLDKRSCCICHDQGTNWVMLTCGHEFHAECFSRWARNCPLCRGPSTLRAR